MKGILFLPITLFKTFVLRRRIPLAASWRITRRCNYRCRYCGYGNSDADAAELTTEQVFGVIDQLSLAGIRRIGFTGGEPFIRDDFGDILDYCSRQKMFISVNTNGSCIHKHIDHLKKIRRLNLSLDGPRDVNDAIRGEGSFDNVMRALEIARENHIYSIEWTAVLSGSNIHAVRDLIALAERLKVRVNFQVATSFILGTGEKNPLGLSGSHLKQAISTILAARRSHACIGNSSKGLAYLAGSPQYRPIYCVLGNSVVRISPDGRLYRCDNRLDSPGVASRSILEVGFTKAWEEVEGGMCKNGCGCAKAIESSLALNGNISALYSMIMGAWGRRKYRDR